MKINHCGEIVGGYEILDKTPQKDSSGHYLYKCRCVYCSKIEMRDYRTLKSQKGIRCSHFDIMGFPAFPVKNPNGRVINSIFNAMKRRCYDPNDASYHWYGKKGIKICDEWLYNPMNFLNWAIKNGYKKGLSIDRIDSTKDYCPENCRFISMSENSRRAGKVNWITINGETLTGRQWSKKIGKSVNFVNYNIRKNGLDYTIEIIKSILSGDLV